MSKWKSNRPEADGGKLRIIGGTFRGRQISYSGDQVTRPMKDNIREALFNLVGGWVKGKATFDLFAGTGAMGLEAMSRGASRGFLIERHFPTVRIIRENVRLLDENMNVEVDASDSFFWVRQFIAQKEKWPEEPWVIFCCPPYNFYLKRTEELMVMLQSLLDAAPEESVMVVESDSRFDVSHLPDAERWTTRQYAPAQISVLRKIPPREEMLMDENA